MNTLPDTITTSVSSPLVYASTMYKCKYGKTAELTHQTYHQWHRDKEFCLNADGDLNIVLGDEVMPVGRAADCADFNKPSRRAATIIHAACILVKAYIDKIGDPHAMWIELKTKVDNIYSNAAHGTIRYWFNQFRLAPRGSLKRYLAQPIKFKNMLAASEQAISDEAFRSHLTTTHTSYYNSIIGIIIHKAPES